MVAATAKTKTSEGLSRYQALVPVSVPQRRDGVLVTGQNDLVMAGDYCMLTEEEARNLMATGARTGRISPAVRPASEASEPLPRVLPRQMSGPVRRPPAETPPGYDGPRPDPAGSSQILTLQDMAPESEIDQGMGDQGAMDIPPRGAAANAAARVAAGTE